MAKPQKGSCSYQRSGEPPSRLLLESEMRLGTFDRETHRPKVGERHQRSATIMRSADEMTFLAFGEGSWYANKRAASKTKAREYLGDLHIIAETAIQIREKKVKFGRFKLQHMRPKHIDDLTTRSKNGRGIDRETPIEPDTLTPHSCSVRARFQPGWRG